MIYLLQGVDRATRDAYLFEYDFSANSIAQFIEDIGTSGGLLERAAFARCFDLKAGSALPGLMDKAKGRKAQEAALAFLQSGIQGLSIHYGREVIGDMQSMAYTILTEYGSFSMLDFILFFERAKSGNYKNKFQSVNTRGINYEFLQDWLEQFAEERDQARMEVYKQFPKKQLFDGLAKEDADAATQIMRESAADRQKRLSEWERLEKQANELRDKWRAEMYETVLFRQAYKTVLVETWVEDKQGNRSKEMRDKEIMCEPTDTGVTRIVEHPVHRPKDGAMQRQFKKMLYEYVCPNDRANTDAMFLQVQNLIEKKYGTDWQVHEAAEMKSLLIQVSEFRRNWPVNKIVEAFLVIQHPKAAACQIQASAVPVIQEMKGWYYTEYLPVCIKRAYPPLKQDEYIWLCAFLNYVDKTKENHILKLILE